MGFFSKVSRAKALKFCHLKYCKFIRIQIIKKNPTAEGLVVTVFSIIYRQKKGFVFAHTYRYKITMQTNCIFRPHESKIT